MHEGPGRNEAYCQATRTTPPSSWWPIPNTKSNDIAVSKTEIMKKSSFAYRFLQHDAVMKQYFL